MPKKCPYAKMPKISWVKSYFMPKCPNKNYCFCQKMPKMCQNTKIPNFDKWNLYFMRIRKFLKRQRDALATVVSFSKIYHSVAPWWSWGPLYGWAIPMMVVIIEIEIYSWCTVIQMGGKVSINSDRHKNRRF